MGKEISSHSPNKPDRVQYRRKVQRCLDTLARMLADGSFSAPRKNIGLEVELNLVDKFARPAMTNESVLAKLASSLFTTEIGQHNIELNVPPSPLAGDHILRLEDDLNGYLDQAQLAAKESDATVSAVGIVPTLTREHTDAKWLTNSPRYHTLNDQIVSAKGERNTLSIEGTALAGQQQEQLRVHTESVMVESAGTSMQLHVQLAPEEFAAHWNAAQCLAGAQLAIGANSPFLLGKALWQETRIPLFLQATDTRPEELKNQGVRPRVWFGERWITSIFDLFEENVRYFPSLLLQADAEDPVEALESGFPPKLSELCLHNGTVWRWNRPVYDVMDDQPHLRVENRVLPAGPTVLDMLANAAFFYGVQQALAEQERPVWTQMSFQAAENNFYAGARDGFDARLYWPGVGWCAPDELVLRVLLPLAHEGLRNCNVSDAARERYLNVIEQRCVRKQSGAQWQRKTVELLHKDGADRQTALTEMFIRYLSLAATGEPVHTWPVSE